MYPTGTVTFLFTDLQDSSRLWQLYPDRMQADLASHDAILRQGVEEHEGLIVKTTGDGLHAVFNSAGDALKAAVACQQALLSQTWSIDEPLRVRMGLHTGQAQWRDGDYYGSPVNRAARVMSAAAGSQLLLTAVTAELVRDELPPDVSLIDLGQHRLRSFDRPERLYQISHPDLPGDFGPLKSTYQTPNNLPTQLSSFIGRETEKEQVREILVANGRDAGSDSARRRNRLLTLTGPGGTGKTRLSLHVARAVLDHFPDGVWLVELAPLTDPQHVVQAAAEQLGIREQPGRPLLSMLVDDLKTKETLLILDNCEHVIDASANLAEQLLRGCPRLFIMASSREALGIAGERAYRVRSLSMPENERSLSDEEATQYDAVRLFVTRAGEVRNGFRLDQENTAPILQICRRLDGIPLAIELAAARARMLTPQQILSRLDDRFRLLTGGSRTALPRQRTLQALIDWSYDLLSEVECVLLRRLSVFSGSWSLEAAEAVAGIDPIEPYEILDLLEQLNGKSLISVKEGVVGMRYSMLETVRQYAQEKLVESSEADLMRDRHLDYFVGQSEVASTAIMELRIGDWVERLAGDVDNQRAARGWALENNLDAAFRLVTGLSARIAHIYPPMEMLQYLETVISRAESLDYQAESPANSERRRRYGAGLAAASDLALIQGIGGKSYDYATRAIPITRESEDIPALLVALLMAAVTVSFTGNMAEAKGYHEEINALTAGMPANWIKALAMISFGTVLRSPNPVGIDKSWQDWEMGMAMLREGGDLWGLGFGHAMASGAAFVFNDPDKSQFHAERSLEILSDFGDSFTANIPRSRLADLARQRGDLVEAADLYKELILSWRNATQYGAMARCLECLAFVGHAQAEAFDGQLRHEWTTFSTTLFGAADTLRSKYKAAMTLVEQNEYQEHLAGVKELAADEAFQEAWQKGQRMSPDQLVAFIQTQ